MSDVSQLKTSLINAINVCLSSIGEIKADAPNDSSANVVMAKQIIEEVSRDVQSKGWWFNTTSSGINILINKNSGASETFSDTLPEEARRYIAIRSARIFQSRVVGSEELFKFTFEEEKVSLAILTQAHVRNGGNSTSFTSFPAEIKNMGVEEVMFLQQTAEEKLLTLRLSTELKSGAKIDAETELVKDQEALVNQQRLTEVEETSKRASEKALVDAQELKIDAERILVQAQELDVNADTALKGKQGFLIDAQKSQTLTESLLRSQQTLTEVKETAKREAETSLLGDQEQLVTNQAATELKRALDIVTDSALKTKQGLLIDNQAATELKNALKVVADTAGVVANTDLTGKQAFLVEAQKLKTDAERALLGVQQTDVAADTTLKGKQGLLIDAQKSQALTDTLLRSQQVLTEINETKKRTAETELVKDQEELVTKQALTEVKRALDIVGDTALKSKQGTLIDNQAATELKNALKVVADTTLVAAQELKVDADRALTNAQEANVTADTTLKGKQGTLIDAQASQTLTDTLLRSQQVLTETKNTTKVGEEAKLLTAQELKVDAEKLLVDAQELKVDAEKELLDAQRTQVIRQSNVQDLVELNFHSNSGFSMAIDGVAAGRTFRDFAAEMRMMGFQETAFQTLPAYKKVELIKDAKKLRDSTATEQGTDNLNLVNRVMRLIAESPVNDIGANSLASVTYRLLDEVDEDLQGRGWYFNTDHDVELSPSNGVIDLDDSILSVEVADIPTYIKEKVVGDNMLIRRDGKTWDSTVKATTITQEIIAGTPKKYREYLMVRVALIITELYPHSGIDVQRLTKMEAELKAYFKDRENDEANYTVFDNYDVASRIGINRNYQLI